MGKIFNYDVVAADIIERLYFIMSICFLIKGLSYRIKDRVLKENLYTG